MAVDDACNDDLVYLACGGRKRKQKLDSGSTDCWKGYAICYPGDQGTGRAQRWRYDIGTGESIDHDCGDDVESYIDGLKESRSFGEVSGVFELCDEGEECVVAGCEVLVSILTRVDTVMKVSSCKTDRMRKRYQPPQ